MRQVHGNGAAAGRICIVTAEIAGPDYNGGIGTANRGLALALQRAGFAVDVLYTRVESGLPFAFRGSFAEQVASFRALGINLMCIAHEGRWNDWLGKSLRVMEILQARSYDVAFFDDTHGTAYYTALAKRSGAPALARTRLVVVTHSATQWIAELNQAPIGSLEDIRVLEIERRSIELADVVVSPSAYILGKYKSYGWTLPANTLVRPNILPFSAERAVPPRTRRQIEEIVFFGRLERRKGLWLFCEVLDRLKYDLAGTKVTFLGKLTHEDGELTGFGLLRRSAAWPFAPTLLYNYDREQALSYLKGGKRLAVMPSREDNSPCVILECLMEGIPFIASAGSGGQELISADDHAACLFQPDADHLEAKLRGVLTDGAVTVQPSFVPENNIRQTVGWVAELVGDARAAGADEAETSSPQPAAGVLLLLAPDGMSPELIADSGRETALRHPGTQIEVFVEDVAPVAAAVTRGAAAPANLNFDSLASFAERVRSPRRGAAFVAVSRLDQPIPADVLARADLAFRRTGIDAFTVMRGHALETVRPDQPFICTGPFHWVPEAYRTGNARALMAVSQDSNAGLLLLRPERSAILAAVPPTDPQLCRLKDIDLYIHEALLALSAGGGRFELLPDCFIPAAATPATCETYELPRIALRHLAGVKKFAPGSEQALLARLSVELFAGAAGTASAERQLAGLSARVGESILLDRSYWPPAEAFATFSRVAHAAGRPELALALISKSLVTEGSYEVSGVATVSDMAMLRAQTVSLAELFAAGRHDGLNLDHPWSLKFDAETEEIEIHPNSSHEGIATLIFPAVPFPARAQFTCEIELKETAKGPVRFEVDLQAQGADPQQFGWVLLPGERKPVSFNLPQAFTRGCDVLVTTSMVRRRDSTEGAHAKWHRPSFRPI